MGSYDLPAQNTLKSVSTEAFSSENSSKKIILALLYFTSIPIFLFLLVLTALFVRQASTHDTKGLLSFQSQAPKYQAVPQESSNSNVIVKPDDARVKSLEDFFKRYNSPLFNHAQTIVDEADKHQLDYRLIPAIAMQESTLCKKIIKNSHNCWGFGIYDNKITRFDNYDDAIKTVTATLAKQYVAKGLSSPDDIMKKYTPSSDGSWADAVNLVMSNLQSSL